MHCLRVVILYDQIHNSNCERREAGAFLNEVIICEQVIVQFQHDT